MANEDSFRSVLVPLDGSALAEQAVPLASRIAQRAGSKLRLGLVHKLPNPPFDSVTEKLFTSIELAIRKSERSYLRSIQARLREGGIRLTSAVTLTGAVGPALVTYARELGIDLVVMATHGRGGIRRAWLGSIADHLIRHLEIPVLLVRPEEDRPKSDRAMTPGQILVPLDGSPLAEEALDAAVKLARLWDAELTLLQVVWPVSASIESAVPVPSAYDQVLTDECRRQAQDYIDDVAERLRGQGLRAAGAAVIGWSAAGSILDAARPEHVAMVVIATHGRGGLRRFALGSVADKVVRGADVPVLVYRPAVRVKSKRQPSRRVGSRRSLCAP
jgi:nucleotide-binding universal stress UspA family protein